MWSHRIKVFELFHLFFVSVAIVLPILIAHRGLKKKSLSMSGAVAGIAIAAITILCHWAFLFALLGFYLTGSKVTKYKARITLVLTVVPGSCWNKIAALADSLFVQY